jgi:HD-like signal output (HDOD) protein
MLDLNVVVENIYDLEPLPPSVPVLAALVEHEDSDLGEIADVISLDPPLTAKLLRAANSAANAARSPITSVRGAVVRMGLDVTLSLAVGAVAHPRLNRSLPQYGYSEGQLWNHSVAASLAAELVAKRCEAPSGSVAAALLHDIGKLIISRYLEPEILERLARVREEQGCSPCEAEGEVLGVHSGEVGGLLAQHWKLPETIVQGITHHDNPNEAESLSADVVHMANLVAIGVGAGLGDEEEGLRPQVWSLERLGLVPSVFEVLREDTTANLEKVLETYAACQSA